jgi:hypothetical protein
MKRKWWLVGIVAVCLVAGACSGSIAAMAVKLQQRLSLGSPQNDSPPRPVPQKPARSPYHPEGWVPPNVPGVPDGTLPAE